MNPVSAAADEWADTDAQYLCAEAASVVYRERGLIGLSPAYISDGEKNTEGKIKFFKRKGVHEFSRDDWDFYINCLEK